MVPVTLLRLRMVQLRRGYPGWWPVLLVIVVVGFPMLVRALHTDDPMLVYYLCGALLLGLMAWHQRRPDLAFVRKHVERPVASLMVEYVLYVFPFVVGAALADAWSVMACLLLGACAIAAAPVARSNGVRLRWLRSWIPAVSFEWRAAVQRTWPLVMVVWALALAFCWLPVLPLLLTWLLTLIATEQFVDCEPRAMLLASAHDAHQLVNGKLGRALGLMTLLVAPILVGATIAKPEWWWVHLLFGLGQLGVIALSVTLKYKEYRPGARLSANGIVVGIGAIFSLLGLFPFPVLMVLTERPKAIANMHTYFHATDH